MKNNTNKYSRGKIYKITSLVDPSLVYIGSTTQKRLSDRLSQHVSKNKRFVNGVSTHGCSSHAIIQLGDYEITLIESFPCESKDELVQRERYYIDSMICVNKRNEGRTPEEKRQYDRQYRKDNKDHIEARNKKYRDEHPEKMNALKSAWNKANKDKVRIQQAATYQRRKMKLLATIEDNNIEN